MPEEKTKAFEVLMTDESPETKRCYACESDLPLEKFGGNRGQPDGLNTRCKDCDRVHSKAQREKRKEKRAAMKDLYSIMLEAAKQIIREELNL